MNVCYFQNNYFTTPAPRVLPPSPSSIPGSWPPRSCPLTHPLTQCPQGVVHSPHVTHILVPLLAKKRFYTLMTILFQNSHCTSCLYQTFWHLITFCLTSFTICFSLSVSSPDQAAMNGVLGHVQLRPHPQYQAHRSCSVMDICIFLKIHLHQSPLRSQGKQPTPKKLL